MPPATNSLPHGRPQTAAAQRGACISGSLRQPDAAALSLEGVRKSQPGSKAWTALTTTMLLSDDPPFAACSAATAASSGEGR